MLLVEVAVSEVLLFLFDLCTMKNRATTPIPMIATDKTIAIATMEPVLRCFAVGEVLSLSLLMILVDIAVVGCETSVAFAMLIV